MESKYTNTPWHRDEKLSRVIFDSNGISIGSMYTNEDVHRILCCVNACDGIDNPSTLIAEHKMMREALERIINLPVNSGNQECQIIASETTKKLGR